MNTFENVPYTPLFERYSKAPLGYEDQWYAHYYEITTVAAGTVNQFPFPIDKDADFYWRASFAQFALLSFNVLLWDAEGNQMASAVDLAENVFTGPGQPSPMYPEIFCGKGSTPQITITDISVAGGGGVFKLALLGVKRYKVA